MRPVAVPLAGGGMGVVLRRPDTSWIDLSEIGAGAEHQQQRGVVTGQPGLYLLGRLFQFALASSMIHGVGSDAA